MNIMKADGLNQTAVESIECSLNRNVMHGRQEDEVWRIQLRPPCLYIPKCVTITYKQDHKATVTYSTV